MIKKITTVACANIAFIKYWGRFNHKLFIPLNNNISMTMSGCVTKATIELIDPSKEDTIQIKYFNKDAIILDKSAIKAQNIFNQIDRIRKLSGRKEKVFIKTESNFPADAGIASSASSFAAMTSALLLIYGLKEKFEDKKELSRQIRLSGSASAVRSAYGGFVEMYAGKDHESTYAVQLADENHWDLVDVVAITSTKEKKVSSSEGHELATTSPYLKTRIKEMQSRIKDCREAILEKDFTKLGKVIEADCISLHLIMMTSVPAIYYWNGATMDIIRAVVEARETGLESYFTIDAGANVHVICHKKDVKKVEEMLKSINGVSGTIYNEAGPGVYISDEHL